LSVRGALLEGSGQTYRAGPTRQWLSELGGIYNDTPPARNKRSPMGAAIPEATHEEIWAGASTLARIIALQNEAVVPVSTWAKVSAIDEAPSRTFATGRLRDPRRTPSEATVE